MWVWLGILAGLGWTAARVAIPFLTGQAIDEGIVPGNFEVALEWMGIILAVGVIQAICTGLRRYAAFRLAFRVETDLRMRLVAHLQRLHFAFHDQAQTGQLMAHANTDIQQINNVVLLIPLTIASTLTMVAVVVILVLQQSRARVVRARRAAAPQHRGDALHATACIPVGLQLQQELADLSGVVEESVAGVRVVKGFGAERLQSAAARGRSRRASTTARSTRRGCAPTSCRSSTSCPTLGLVGILWYGGHQVLDGNLTVGDIVAFNLYVLMLIWPLRMIGMLARPARRVGRRRPGRIDEVLVDRPRDRRRARTPRRCPTGPGEVRFERRARSATGRVRPVLDGLDLDDPRRRGGRARRRDRRRARRTVARLIPRFYDVDAGRVRIDGADVRDLRLERACGARSASCSRTRSCSPTRCATNIAFADPEAPMEQVVRAARLAGADEFIASCPTATTPSIGEHGYSLSGGQRQRIAIARAVLADPRVLILDDATSSVDPTKEHEIRAALAEVMQGRTTIIIAHRPATIALADRVVLLDDGRVVADGTHDGLLATSSASTARCSPRAEVEERAERRRRRRRPSPTTAER